MRTIMHRFIKNISFRLVCVLLAVFMVFLSAGCAHVNINRSVVTLNTISSPSENYELHCTKVNNLKAHPIAKSGLIELLIDTTNKSFSIIQTDENLKEASFYWSALPILKPGEYADSYKSKASVIDLEVLGGTDKYLLNSQDNSVAYNKASFELIDNGAKFTYNIFPDETTANKQVLNENDIAFSVELTITLVDGSLFADFSYSNLSGNKNAVITNLKVLNWFGAYNQSEKDDFLLVPDGCGAVINTSVYDNSFEPLTFSVYGDDISSPEKKCDGNAIIPAFGLKHSSLAFVALITKGDAISKIYADKATDSNEYNIISSGFEITPYDYSNGTLTVSKNSYNPKDGLEICYRFLSGSNATYSGLACACREQLIRNSVLSTRNVEENVNLPFNLSIIGSVTENYKNIFNKTIAVTDIEQTTDMITRMKNKGINNINIRYTGAFDGGINQKDISNFSTLFKLGSKKEFNELYDYIDSQNMNLYYDINILSSSNGFSTGQNAISLTGKSLTKNISNPYYEFIKSSNYKWHYRSLSSLKKLVSKILINSKNYNFSGFCIADIASVLYSDYSSDYLNRCEAAKLISDSIIPLTTNRSTMINGGNIYIIKNAEIAINLPQKTSVTNSGAYTAVPFVQLILHGSIDYSGSAVNLDNNPKESLLRSIEYGSCPYYEWSYSELSSKHNDPYYYDKFINEASEYYSKSNKILSDLRCIRIIEHSKIADGVFKTEYENGSIIYVNYTDADFTVSGVVICAGDFTRLN